MEAADLLKEVYQLMKNCDFELSRPCRSRESCFDVAVRKGDVLGFIKTLEDASEFSREDASELMLLSRRFSAFALLVSMRLSGTDMMDDAVYDRHGVMAVTPRTLRYALKYGMYPLVEVIYGNCFVNIDHKALREEMRKLGLSRGRLASLIGVSRRTIYGYERGLSKATVKIAYKLEATLGVPIVKPINIFKSRRNRRISRSMLRRVIQNPLLRSVMRKFRELRVSADPVSKAPFDFVAGSGSLKLIGGVMTEGGCRRVYETSSVAKVCNLHALFVTDGRVEDELNVPVVRWREFKGIRNVDELQQLLNV